MRDYKREYLVITTGVNGSGATNLYSTIVEATTPDEAIDEALGKWGKLKHRPVAIASGQGVGVSDNPREHRRFAALERVAETKYVIGDYIKPGDIGA